MGKCTEELKCLVDEETRNAVSALAWAADMSVSEYLRRLVWGHVWGHGTLLRLQAARTKERAGTGQEAGAGDV